MEKILRALEITIGNCLVVFGVLALLKVVPVNVVMVFAFINLGVVILHSIVVSAIKKEQMSFQTRREYVSSNNENKRTHKKVSLSES